MADRPIVLPGFYFDEAKKKYFKIQPNHTVPSGSAYSSDGVKRRRTEDEYVLASARAKERSKGHIRRARVLADPLLGVSLRRELGLILSPNSFPGLLGAYCHEWRSSGVLSTEADDSLPLRMIPLRQYSHTLTLPGEQEMRNTVNNSTVAMGDFDFDPRSRSLFAPFNGESLFEWASKGDVTNLSSAKCDRVVQESMEDDGNRQPNLFIRCQGTLKSTNHSPITSININHSSRLLLTTWRAPTRSQNMLIASMTEAEAPYTPSGLLSSRPLIVFRLQSHLGSPTTIWAATPGKSHSPFSFAVASENGVYAIGKGDFENTFVRPPKSKEENHEVLAVECLSHFPAVILSGARNGMINVLDVRVPQNHYQSGNKGIMHPSTVAHIKQLDTNLITVSGLESTLCNYDLRFTKKHPRASLWHEIRRRQTKHGARSVDSECTLPVLVYPEHENDANTGLGFDVDPEAGVAAAVQDDDANTVKIFSLKTGARLRSMDATAEGGSIDTANIKALRFIRDGGEGAMKSLWVAKGTKIIRYAW